MDLETIKLTSSYTVILSEENNSDSVDAKFIICDFKPNGNNISLNRNTIENWLDTLLNKPVVGKVITRYDGKEDFSGHNAKIVEEIDEDGNKIKTIEFDTQAFGSFYSVQIETIDDIEYITANAKIWKRFKKAYKVFKNRVESKKGLKTSWEINVHESHKEKIKNKNIKVIDSGEFIGHAVLGENVQPAYKSSGVIDVASLEQDNEFFEALSQDMLSLSKGDYSEDKEDDVSIKDNIRTDKGGQEQMGKEDKIQTSDVTHEDLWTKVRRAINNANSDKYYYLSIIYPYNYTAIGYYWDRESQEDFVRFTYTVNSDDTVSITSQEEVKMKFVPVSELESQVSELQGKIDEAEKQIAEAGKLLTEVSKEKEDLEAKIAELEPFKEKVEQMEQAEKERELAEKKVELRTFALEDSLISEDELDSDEKLAQIFAELTLETFEASQEKIEIIKGRRAIEKYKASKNSQKDLNNESTDLETSEKHNNVKPKTDLNNGDGDKILVSATDIIKSLIGQK
ncbi:hypothetical protein [Paenibacillus naphthalenovorans]|uniref:Uncharacterized protein n=1 Tax=Paenibacillus naphthalenovorans TaxID=162209 RepID=A0A0U2W4F4_9BACL|nr:hypothetical protein [Paenibacillus naphthalenovorans]ALS22301.1 hypothetical protein IJ22_19270 [Paenibacillus naphthalenovorans]